MVLQCELKRDRFAILDAPLDASDNSLAGIHGVVEWRSRFDSKYAALYFPWVRVVDPLVASGPTRSVPPSGHVAGAIAGTDLAVGVHKAPANRRIEWAVDASVEVDDEQHGILNSAGVNALRATGGRGLRVQGARTISSDTDWRFVNVRRLISMIEKALETALQWAVFEPNEALTRARATMSITIFLLGLHEAGMFAGATPGRVVRRQVRPRQQPRRRARPRASHRRDRRRPVEAVRVRHAARRPGARRARGHRCDRDVQRIAGPEV